MTSNPPNHTVLSIRGVTKRFGDLVANEAIDLELEAGEILALLGENGAGKTTLMNILFGHYVADEGHIEVADEAGHLRPLRPGSPQAALAAGIGMVHQHFTLAENLTALDNIVLGTEPMWRPFQRKRAAIAHLKALMARAGLSVDLEVPVARLSVGERQRVEILKALYRGARVLILDEPTAVLTPQESDQLFEVLRRLAADGLAVVFISHKLAEVVAISRRVVVMRAGRLVATTDTATSGPAELAALMVGREVSPPKREPQPAGAHLLRMSAVTVIRPDGRTGLDAVDLDVRHGEIVGIAGVSGNGQTALSDVVAGLAAPRSGRIEIDDADYPVLKPRALLDASVGRVPEDRHHDAVVGDMAVWENAILEEHATPRFARRGFIARGEAMSHTRRIIEGYDVRGRGPHTRTRLLSGGNMQKLVLGRVMERSPSLILANQPTRGLDVGAVSYVHGQLLAARGRGAGVLLISEDLDELFALADRIAVIYAGRLSPPEPTEELDRERVGLMMAGHASDTDSGAHHAA